MSKSVAAVALAAATIASSMAVTINHAEARHFRFGPLAAFGIAATAITTAAIISSQRHRGPVVCQWVDRYDRFGNYLGRMQVCDPVPY